jgi:4-hydroxythreonine-4-phosphate dehydrogenase
MNLKPSLISKYPKIKVGITIGDPSGIGPIVALKALQRLKGIAEFLVIGDRWVFEKGRTSPIAGLRYEFIDLKNVDRRRFQRGCVRAEYGQASIEYLDKALGLLRKKEIDCLVTAPISKEAIGLAGFPYKGHTEYFKEKTQTNPEMMLLNKDIRTVLVTRHIPLKDVPRRISRERIKEVVLLTHSSLKKMFLIKEPRIVLCGLNPHASDRGVIGKEEKETLIPAIKGLKRRIKYLYGPLPADTALLKTKNKEYDCAITLYHDQSLIPLKLLNPESGVNLTLGLPFIRTSPLHGTAFDIADHSRLIDPRSTMEAIKLAIQCTLNLKKA